MSLKKIVITSAVLLALASCSPQFRSHGYVPNETDLEQIVVGTDTQSSVIDIIGSPQSTGAVTQDGWYYVESTFRHFTYNKPEEIKREVVALSFDSEGVLTNVERFGLQDGRVVTLSRRVTSLPVKAEGFLAQILGDFGVLDISNAVN